MSVILGCSLDMVPCDFYFLPNLKILLKQEIADHIRGDSEEEEVNDDPQAIHFILNKSTLGKVEMTAFKRDHRFKQIVYQ